MHEERQQPPERFWKPIGRVAARVGSSIASAYRSLDPDLRRHLLQLPLVGLTMIGPRHRPVVARPDDGHRPIICVHGLGGHPGNFLAMRTWFRLRGRSRSYAFPLPADCRLEEMAARLSAFVEEVATVNGLAPDARVALVAHSIGGIVARLALDDRATAARIGALVTLGTPHSGTFLARYGNTPVMLELRPGSELVERLRAQLPWQGPTRLVAFHSSADVLLLPHDSGAVEGAENVELQGLSHYGYLMHPRVFDRVLERISPSRAEGPAVCEPRS